jgi:MFS family permease
MLGLGMSIVPLDTAVNIGFPDITRSFGLPIAMIQWVVICYVLTYAALMLAFGRIGDIGGHARVFRAGLAWSVVAFLLCAAAPGFGWLLVLPLSARGRRRARHQLRAGSGDRALSRGAAQPCGRHVYADLRPRHGVGTADRRDHGGALGLARGVLVSRADRADEPLASARPADRRKEPGGAVRYRRRAAPGARG